MKLELIDITKRFGELVANDEVTLTVEEGEIHGLLGENGAGKTTLMNVLFGMVRPDSGEIRIGGETVSISSPGDAVRAGIGMVHQHFMLVPVFTVAENVVLGFEPTKGKVFYDRRKADANIRRLSGEYGLEVDPDAVVEDLPVGVQQRVEDPESARARRPCAHPRRADGGADAAGDRGSLSHHALTCGDWALDPVHQPQAQGGAGDR